MDTTAQVYPLEQLLEQSEWMTRLAARLVDDRDEAEDLVQQTLIAAARVKPATDRPVRPWLRRVVGNFARVQRRGSRRRRQREDLAATLEPATMPGPDELLERAQMQRQVAELVLGLEEPYRSTVLLRYFEGHASPAIARTQGVAEGTVRWRLKEALDRLRVELDRRHGGDRRAWALVLAPGAMPRAGAAGGGGALKLKGAAVLATAAAVTAVWLVSRGPSERPHGPTAFTWSVAAPAGLRVFGTPLPAPAGAIAGRVRDPAGKPVAGAIITVEARGLPAPRAGAAPVRTAEDGTFLVPDLRDGSYRVTASAADWTSAGRGGIEVRGGATVRGIELSLGRGGFLLTGTVEDSGHGPIAGALVMARAEAGPMRAATDGQGRYRLRLSPGEYNLDAAADGYAPGRTSVSLAADQTRDFRLDPAARISGKVVDRETGQVVAEAIVRARPDREQRPLHTTSGEDGRFTFTSLPPGRVTFSASRGNRVGFASQPLLVSAESAPEVLIRLDPATTIEGRVLDPGGRAVAKARIFVFEGVLDRGTWDGTEMATSDENGRFVVEGVLPGRYQVFARGTGFAPSRSRGVAVRREPARGISLVLPPAAVVSGRVLAADDRPVADAQVRATVRGGAPGNMDGPGRGIDRTTSDAEGRFTLGGLGAGSLEVEAEHPAHGRLALDPTAVEEGVRRELTLRFVRSASLAGLVRWHDGTAAAGARVRWVPFGRGGREPVAITGPDGRFSIPTATPGAGVVQAELASQTFVMHGGGEAPHKQQLTLQPGAREQDVVLTLDRPDATIRGRVLDPEGQPLAGVTVAADPDHRQRWQTHAGLSGRPATTGDDGRFTVTDLQRGSYNIFARDPRFPAAEASSVPTDGKEVTLRFAAGATLAGLVVGAGGQPVDTYELMLVPPEAPGRANGEGSGVLIGVRQSVHAPDGRFRWSGLTPGRFDLLVTTADGRAARQPVLELRGGQQWQDLRLVVAPGATVRGRIVDADTGQPLPGIGIGIQGTEEHVHARSDDEGVFELEGQVPGRTLELHARPAGGRYLPEEREVHIPAGKTVVEMAPLRLLPRAAVPADPGRRRGDMGLRLAERDGVIIAAEVEPSSPAAKAGLSPGSQLLAIGSRRLQGLGRVAANSLLTAPPGSTLDLELRTPDGQQRTVTLRPEGP